MIYVTHDQTEAMTMGDSIAVMAQGRILQLGPPSEVYCRPATKFVACFIGSPPMNVWRAAVGEGGAMMIGCDGPALDPPPGLEGPLRKYAGGHVLAGLRPEGLIPCTGQPSGPSLQGTVEMCEYTGSELFVRVSCSVGELVAKAKDGEELRPGDEVHLRIAAAALHMFDPDTGLRLG